jgi:hypothetical protein
MTDWEAVPLWWGSAELAVGRQGKTEEERKRAAKNLNAGACLHRHIQPRASIKMADDDMVLNIVDEVDDSTFTKRKRKRVRLTARINLNDLIARIDLMIRFLHVHFVPI